VYNRRTVKVITPAASLDIAFLAEVTDMLALHGSDDDELIGAFIDAAADAMRRYLRMSIGQETLELRLDGFPGYGEDALLALGPGVHTAHYPSLISRGDRVDLPYGPVQSIVAVTTWDRSNVSAVLDPGAYFLAQDAVVLTEGQTWPTDLRRADAVAIRYVSGEAVVPAAIRQGIKQHVAAMYECREGCEMPAACKAIVAPYRRMDALGWS